MSTVEKILNRSEANAIKVANLTRKVAKQRAEIVRLQDKVDDLHHSLDASGEDCEALANRVEDLQKDLADAQKSQDQSKSTEPQEYQIPKMRWCICGHARDRHAADGGPCDRENCACYSFALNPIDSGATVPATAVGHDTDPTAPEFYRRECRNEDCRVCQLISDIDHGS